MIKIVLASNNKNKLKEIQQMIPKNYEIVSLMDINCFEDIPETSNTLQGNALQKAQFVYDNYNLNCFADDTGLEVDALDGQPGVYSARYAGSECSAEDNMIKLLKELEGEENRSARFRTVIASIIDGNVNYFEGIVEGEITKEKSGGEGFGYDPIFRPIGHETTFAQMSLEDKNEISHRGRALRKFNHFLSKTE